MTHGGYATGPTSLGRLSYIDKKGRSHHTVPVSFLPERRRRASSTNGGRCAEDHNHTRPPFSEDHGFRHRALHQLSNFQGDPFKVFALRERVVLRAFGIGVPIKLHSLM
jgi:hypothetical protein